ncbi:MmgE/PrpD family protein [Corticibacterium sp. UT-5YL-CI-8]|nr:MmgE/PrpD family protein [Tianweitania sp. UT-5YL-CI-8]
MQSAAKEFMDQPDTKISQRLAHFVDALTFETIPDQVRDRARFLILDAVGIALASTQYEFSHRTLSALREFGDGSSHVIGFGTRLGLRDAVTMNGFLVHALDYDDTHTRGVIHATASCFPTALGVAAAAGVSGRELLTGYVAGMEVGARLASVAKGGFHQTGFHPTGLIGTFACALVAGKLKGLPPKQLAHAQASHYRWLLEAWNSSRMAPGRSAFIRVGLVLPASPLPFWPETASLARWRPTREGSASMQVIWVHSPKRVT